MKSIFGLKIKPLSMKNLKNHNKKENMITKEETEVIEETEETEEEVTDNKEMINNKDLLPVANTTNHLKPLHNFNSKEKILDLRSLSERTKLWKPE